MIEFYRLKILTKDKTYMIFSLFLKISIFYNKFHCKFCYEANFQRLLNALIGPSNQFHAITVHFTI